MAASEDNAVVQALVPKTLTTTQNAIIGALAGTLEVLINQPFVAWKNALQEKRPFTVNPFFLYRGVVINSGSIAPITAVQFAVNGFVGSYFSNSGSRALTDGERLFASAFAGAMSALVSSPAEIVMIQQQKTGKSLLYTARTIIFQHGITTLYKGLTPTIIRESLFTCGYLGLGPVVKDYMVAASPSLFEGRELVATLLSSILAGQVAAVLTQPADTIKTRLQADIGGLGNTGKNAAPVTYTGLLRTISILWREGGIRAFYAGLIPRGLRMTSAIFILTVAGQQLAQLF